MDIISGDCMQILSWGCPLFCNSADLKNKCICPDGSYGLFLTCGQKDLIIYTTRYTCHILGLSFLMGNRELRHTWAAKHCQHCSEWVHPCLCVKVDWITFAHHVTWDALDSFPCWCLDLAILRLAFLDLAADQSPKSQSQELVNHTDTHHKLRQHTAKQLYTAHILIIFYISWASWRGPAGPK
jgi:hypothetical protein